MTVVAPPPLASGPGEQDPLAERAPAAAGRRPTALSLSWSVAVVLAVAAGVVLRFWTSSPMWLDEAISVDLARLPLSDLPQALRHDGHPPLYYALLHGWTTLFGTGDVAVRALSGLLTVVTLPLVWAAGRRLGGRPTAVAALLLVATSPFAIRYATEARMYSLVTFLAVGGYLAVERALERPTPRRLALVAVVIAALLYTHYWAIWLVAAAIMLVAWAERRKGRPRRPSRRVLVALLVGALAFLPWVPVLQYQMAHTGTPWARSVEPFDAAFDTLLDFGGGKWIGGRLLGPVLAGLVLLALLARPVDRWRLDIDLRTVPGARVVTAVAAVTMVLGLGVSVLVSSGYQPRYAAGAFPFVVLAAAVGLGRLPNDSIRRLVIALVVVGGLGGGFRLGEAPRTQAGEIAAAVQDQALPGDLVVYCPDQLRPAMQRALQQGGGDVPAGVSFPSSGPPGRIDWVDYAQRVKAEAPRDFTARVLAGVADDATIWLVTADRYRAFGAACEEIRTDLAARLGPSQTVVARSEDAYERATLYRFDAQ